MAQSLIRRSIQNRCRELLILATLICLVIPLAGCRSQDPRKEMGLAFHQLGSRPWSYRLVVRFSLDGGGGGPVERGHVLAMQSTGEAASVMGGAAWPTAHITPSGVTLTKADGTVTELGAEAYWGLSQDSSPAAWLIELVEHPWRYLSSPRRVDSTHQGKRTSTRYVASLDPIRGARATRRIASNLDALSRARLETAREEGSRWVPSGSVEVDLDLHGIRALVLRDQGRPSGPVTLVFERVDAAP